MFDTQKFFIPLDKTYGLAVSDTDWGLDEIEGLFTTLGGQKCDKLKVVFRKIDPKSYLGAGKLEELANLIAATKLDVLLLDFDVSPSQLKNIEKIVKCLVLDRSGLILEIFNRHARTKEAKLQVELARLEYLMPRLSHLWSHFERQKGSGGSALKGKGMGETQIEVDRRLVKDRINSLRRRMKEVEKSRDIQRKGREDYFKVALVGYTNAGKSTLLNALTHSEVLVEDALFATLDATVKVLNPKSKPFVMAIDTVGFIDRLPHSLVASFRSTLSEVLEADLLVHVLDSADPEVKRHFTVTTEVLKELGAENIPQLVYFNKFDQLKSSSEFGTQMSLLKIWAASLQREFQLVQAPVFGSTFSEEDVSHLREQILKYFDGELQVYEVVVPFEDGKTLAQIFQVGRIEAKRSLANGTFLRFRTQQALAEKLNLRRYLV